MKKGRLSSYQDPFISHIQHEGWEFDSVPDLATAVKDVDCVAIITNHSQYNYQDLLKNATLIIDTRNALGVYGRNNPKVVRL